MISVGLDVHVRNSFACAKDAEGRVLARGRCGNTLLEFAELLAPVERAAKARGEPVRVVLETTTNSRAIKRLCDEYGRQAGIELHAEVLDARKLRIIAESVVKCDRRDAAVLCDLARTNLKLPDSFVPDDEVFQLRERLRARADFVRVRTTFKNRVQAALHRRGILRPARLDVFTKQGREYLASLALDDAGRRGLDGCLACIERLDEQVKEATKGLLVEGKRARWAKPFAVLQSIPGVGPITALTILAELGDAARFRSRAAVANYAGLAPIVRESNESRGRGGISHRGSAHLRAALVEAAWAAVGRAPQYADLFTRVAQRRGKQVAITAVARRILEDAWTLWRKEEPFRFLTPTPRSAASAAG
jgi:transposase